jgi:hypothetical protein
MSVVFRYIEVCQNVGPDITAQSISFESNYVFKELQMQELDFTVVKSPSATDTNGGSACETPQSQTVFILTLCAASGTYNV